MPAIDWITINGFRSIRSIDRLNLGSINVVIGSNGSGKSNFIGAFSFLHAIREGRLKEYVARAGGANSLLFFGSKQTSEISIHVAFDGEVNQYQIDLVPNQNDALVPSRENVYYWNKRDYNKPYARSLAGAGVEAGISRTQNNSVATYVQEHMLKWRVYHFHDTSGSSPMKQTCDIDDNRFLRSDAANLAAFLYMLSQKFPENYNLIVNTVKQVAPFFDDFLLLPSVLNEEKIRLEWRHKSSENYFSASSLSDGTIRFIALATLLLQPRAYCPSVILIDEPELGLHPYALIVLASLIRRASSYAQIIISTQSALLLDNFNPDEVLVCDRVDNSTQLKRLKAEPLSDWLEDYSLGQLWEKAEFGGRPGSGGERR